MTATPPPALQRYLAHRRAWEAGFWLLFWLMQATLNSITVLADIRRVRLPIAAWEPVTWEFSSCLTLLVMMPLLLAFDRRYPLQLDSWRRNLPRHALFTLAWSGLHLAGMVLIRKLVYFFAGRHYDVGSPLFQFGYEYLKDLRSYFYLLAWIYFYRLILLRLQGEARMLTAPDDGAPVEPIERPARFLVRKLGREFLVAAADIEWLEAAGNYVNLHLRGHLYPLRSTMAAIEAQLDPARFSRVHRSFIVNIDHLAEIRPLENGDAELKLADGSRVPCSRRYRAALRSLAAEGKSAAWSREEVLLAPPLPASAR